MYNQSSSKTIEIHILVFVVAGLCAFVHWKKWVIFSSKQQQQQQQLQSICDGGCGGCGSHP